MKQQSGNKWSNWWQKLKNIYRLQLVEEKTYDVKFVIELNRLNVITISGIIIAFFTIVNFFFIAYTPLKQYIPGYGSTNSRKDIVELKLKTEKLEELILANEKYNDNLKNILQDKIKVTKLEDDIRKVSVDSSLLANITKNEAKFISEIEKGLKNASIYDNLRYKNQKNILKNLHLHQPSEQKITQRYTKENPEIVYHFEEKTPIYTTLDGKIISAELQPNNTYHVIIQHTDDIISKYKNIIELKYKITNFTKAGTILGFADAKNKLQYEIWHKGSPINPEKYF